MPYGRGNAYAQSQQTPYGMGQDSRGYTGGQGYRPYGAPAQEGWYGGNMNRGAQQQNWGVPSDAGGSMAARMRQAQQGYSNTEPYQTRGPSTVGGRETNGPANLNVADGGWATTGQERLGAGGGYKDGAMNRTFENRMTPEQAARSRAEMARYTGGQAPSDGRVYTPEDPNRYGGGDFQTDWDGEVPGSQPARVGGAPSMPTRPGPGVTQEQWARAQQPGADPRFGGGAGGWATTGQTRSGELASVQGRGMGQQLGQAMQAMPKPQPRGAAPGGQMQMQPQAPAPMPQQAPQQQPMAPTENVQAASPGGVGSYNTSYQQALQAKGRGFQQDDATVQANFDRLMKEDPFTARQYANQNPAWYQRNQMQIKDQHFGGDAARRNAWTNTNTAGGYSNRNINNADVQRRLMSTLG